MKGKKKKGMIGRKERRKREKKDGRKERKKEKKDRRKEIKEKAEKADRFMSSQILMGRTGGVIADRGVLLKGALSGPGLKTRSLCSKMGLIHYIFK